jgi:hypothetical protein
MPDGARLSYSERRAFRRVRRVATEVDIVDLSVTGVAVRVLGDSRLSLGDTVSLTYRGATGAVVVRHLGDVSPAGSRVYGLEVRESSHELVDAVRRAVGAERGDVHWRWERPE